MGQLRRVSVINHSSDFFLLCLAVPVLAFMTTLIFAGAFSGISHGVPLTSSTLREFLDYYDRFMIDEFLVIFVNNFTAVLVVVFFTPAFLWLRNLCERLRNRRVMLSAFETYVLYLFPVLFMVRQAVNIAVVLNNTAVNIKKHIFITFAGIILPHGLPEFLAFAVAGAIGMSVTKRVLASRSRGWPVSLNVITLLMVFTALCAFLEVYFTPRIFALLMAATGLSV